MSGTLEWFEDFLSKTDKTDFRQATVPDVIELWIHDEDTIYAKWDLSQELREKGAAFTSYKNASQNIDIEFVFLHEDLVEKFKDDETLNKILEKSLNDSLKLASDWNSTTILSSGGRGVDFYMFVGLGGFAMLLGLVGLAFKSRAASQAKVVKMTRICGSLMCILTAVILILEEAMSNEAIIGRREGRHMKVDALAVVIGGAANALGKAFLMSWKIFTLIIYIFQNIMLYRPFLFREHKKALGKWFLRASLAQSVTILAGFSIWALFLILETNEICDDIMDHTRKWHVVLISVGSIGFSGSLLLSVIFVVGYYRKNFNGLRQSEVKSVGKTMISCSIEVFFDLMIVLVYFSGQVPCLSFNPYHFLKFSLLNQPRGTAKCDISFKWFALDFGLSKCTTFILQCQPVLQEAFFVFSEVVGLCCKKKCW